MATTDIITQCPRCDEKLKCAQINYICDCGWERERIYIEDGASLFETWIWIGKYAVVSSSDSPPETWIYTINEFDALQRIATLQMEVSPKITKAKLEKLLLLI